MTQYRGFGIGRTTWLGRVLTVLSCVALTASMSTAALSATSVAASPTSQVERPVGALGTVVVPDRFLRQWDPVTVFFESDKGPVAGGPEDAPGRVVTMSPVHPGAWTWLDARTLQFRPAEPWPPLTRFALEMGGRRGSLTTLMSAPSTMLPGDGAEGLDEVESVTLTFNEPIDTAALHQMLTIELRPLPGVGAERARWLGADDFELKVMERDARSSPASYVVALHHPIPLGNRAIVHFRLSLDDRSEDSFHELSFATAEPFRVLSVGCLDKRFPIAADGTRYSREQALDCGRGTRRLALELSSAPRALGPVEGRNLVRFTPAVKDLSYEVHDRSVEVTGGFEWDTIYKIEVTPTVLTDLRGRPLTQTGASELYAYFRPLTSYLRWGASQGIVERLGPQQVPLEGRGDERADLRIHKIEALDRSFWPFPDRPVTVDESKRPAGPGEQVAPHVAAQPIGPDELTLQLEQLGSPTVSTLIDLALKREGSGATFGIDLQPHFERISGARAPGTYLVGLRRLGGETQRSWARIQVTDLSLTVVEERRAVRFHVGSLATGRPIAAASVRIEGADENRWTTVAEGTTEADGSWRWQPPGDTNRSIYRLVVQKGSDTLVLDATRPPEGFADNHWSPTSDTWLQWTQWRLDGRDPETELLCHLFTERPVYRPEETVHLKAYFRERDHGKIGYHNIDGKLKITGPGDLEWTFPLAFSPLGSFDQDFADKELPTGVYTASIQDTSEQQHCHQSFRIEAYRIPTFEVNVTAPDEVPLDHEFEVGLTATYYAGGRVAGRPVVWRVTQFPYTWTPSRREGFQYSSDGRFGRTGRFEATPRMDKLDTTNADGGSSLTLNPTIEPNAQPRSYVVEATVTGPDDQTVTSTRRIHALPPFVLGLKAPRYIERAKEIAAEVLVAGADGKLIAGREVSVRLLNRQWHSYLRASDFSDGVARYVTDVVDEQVAETKVTSGAEPVTVTLPIARSGVYVVELEAHDRLDRAQVVAIDLYAGGDEPVTWTKPEARVFAVVTDKKAYAPGESATLVVESPYQDARALVVVEAPEGNEYHWLDVHGGAATFNLPVGSTFVPRVPVHFILTRGRIEGTAPQPGNTLDLGRPATMAATAWVTVVPVENRVDIKLDYPPKARPGETIDVVIHLADHNGKPLAGEVTLWLVDQAVLALGREQELDPLPDFITPARTFVEVRDTRNLAFGLLPFAVNPGGDGGDRDEDLLDRVTVRKNFQPVPYWNPSIEVGADGLATVSVELPDSLTIFKLRAKAASGADRFGFATGQIAVRLPVIVQPALPRFVRPGDRFSVAAIGRIVEGAGGAGRGEIRVDGLVLDGDPKQDITWDPQTPHRFEFAGSVATPSYGVDGALVRTEVSVTVGVERSSDGARDAFEVKLPIRDDRDPIKQRVLQDLEPGVALNLPEPSEAARAGFLRRTILLSNQPALVRMAAGLDFLLSYPYGCTEQRVSRAAAAVALKNFREVLHQDDKGGSMERMVRDTLEWIPGVVGADNLVSYWPGSTGYVSLTAWVFEFLTEAKEAGFAVEPKLYDKLSRALETALRSDASKFIDGEAWGERTMALEALARAGKFNSGYAAELARKSNYLDPEGVGAVLYAFARSGDTGSKTVKALADDTHKRIVTRLHQGTEIYGGIQGLRGARNGLILPSETRTVAVMVRGLARVQKSDPRVQFLTDALVTLGRDDGWGTTNASAAALLALTEVLEPPFAGAARSDVKVTLAGSDHRMELGPNSPTGYLQSVAAGAGTITRENGDGPVVARAELVYIPEAPGSVVAPAAQGFVVTREWLRVRGDDVPADKLSLGNGGQTLSVAVSDVIEEHVQVVNPKDRHYVAVVIPLAAGMEPLNPHLATAPPEAQAKGQLSTLPSYAAFYDDAVSYYYDTLAKGTYDFYFRTRATTGGTFIQPAAKAEMMYDGAVRGNSAGAAVEITRQP